MIKKKEDASSSVTKSLKDLQKALEDLEPSGIGATIKVEDIYLPLNHLFNSAAKKAMKREVKELNPKREVFPGSFVTDTIQGFGAIATGDRKIFNAAQRVANTINMLADLGYMTGSLSKLTLIKLHTEEWQLDKYAIISHIAMTGAGIEYLKKNPFPTQISDGEVPSEF